MAPVKYSAALAFEVLGLMRASGPAVVEVDELCFFDRELNTAELARLRGETPK
jgi:hypothetical protein